MLVKHGSLGAYNQGCRCDDCRGNYSDYQKARYAKSPEYFKARTRARKKADPETYRARERESYQRRQADPAHRERMREHSRLRRERHPDAVRDANRRWKRKNRAWVALQNARRRHGVTGNGAEYGNVILADPCVYCGCRPVEIDHIDAIAAGGTNDWDNLTPACASCNRSKQHKPFLAWMAERNA